MLVLRSIFIGTLLFAFCPSLWAQGKAKTSDQTNDDSMWIADKIPDLPVGVDHKTFRSTSMKRDVGYCIFLPPSYKKNYDARYPVLYHLHGAGGNETRSIYSAKVLHEGILEGRWPEMIVVFPNGGRSTMYQDSGDGRFMAETMVIKELLPHIDATYRTIATREGRGIEGFSMGGRGSTHLAMKYPELFGSLFNQSGNVYHVSDVSKLPNPYLGESLDHLQSNDPFLNLQKNLDNIRKHLRIRLGCGTADPEHLTTVREYHQALINSKIEHEYFEVDGLDHSQKKMIDGMKQTWFDFHVAAMRRNGIDLQYANR
jgi:endo-1,4-beta-xylanase